MKVSGIHHLTAISADIQRNKEFYTQFLGLRLVKKSVNQDDVKAYHLFYADAAGTPGTDITFFDWPNAGRNLPGPGNISLTSLRVPAGSLDWWERRFADAEILAERSTDPLGRERLLFADPEGQRLEFIDDAGLPTDAQPWDQVVPLEFAPRGLFAVDIPSIRYEGTRSVLTELLGFETVSEGETEVLQVGTESTVAQVRLTQASGRYLGQPGAGGVHHVAFRVKDDDELRAFQAKIEERGIPTSGYVDRFWFHSLYFREPGGVLFELATDGPGFGIDEDSAHLGEKLVLPPFFESRRAQIEAGLKPL